MKFFNIQYLTWDSFQVADLVINPFLSRGSFYQREKSYIFLLKQRRQFSLMTFHFTKESDDCPVLQKLFLLVREVW
jgi:hypothetical protein